MTLNKWLRLATSASLAGLLISSRDSQSMPKVFQNGITVISQERISEPRLRKLADEIALLRPLMTKKNAIRAVYLTRDDNGAFFEPADSLGPARVKSTTKEFVLPDSVLEAIGFHEAAHAVFLSSADSTMKKRLKTHFNDAMERFGWIAPFELDPTSGRKHPIFSLFKESVYFDYAKVDPLNPDIYGHPWDGPHELFASASAVMRHAPAKFLQRMRAIAVQDTASHNLALNISRTVLSAYAGRDKGIFSPELLRYIRNPPRIELAELQPPKRKRESPQKKNSPFREPEIRPSFL